MPDLSQLWTSIVSNPLIQLSVRLAGLYILAIYLAMVFWTVRDAQQRTENQLLPYLAGLMVVVLNIFGIFLYLIIRPKETLGEAEQRVVCPTCKERVQEEFILCPTCRTRLKRVCPNCGKLIRPEWNICPFCAKDFDERDWTVHPGGKAEGERAAPSR